MRAKIVLIEVIKNLLLGIEPVARLRMRRARTATPMGHITSAYLKRYAYDPFQMVSSAVGSANFKDSVVVEIGPGDHIPVALLALAAGARRYIAVDRFRSRLNPRQSSALYSALVQDMRKHRPELFATLCARGIDEHNFQSSDSALVEHVNLDIEHAHCDASANIVFSYNVLEHVSDIERAVEQLWDLAAPGALGVHRIDFGPHDNWAKRANPLEWLELSDTVWKLTSSNRGTPNRLRLHEIQQAFERCGFITEVTVLDQLDDNWVAKRMDRLSARFRTMSAKSIGVLSALLLCKKPDP